MSQSARDDGREYLRVSLIGRGRSVDEQHAENLEAAAERGWTLSEPYRDEDRSASRYARKVREDFGRLVGDLEADRFGADHLILWEGSRGSREIEEWVRLVKLCERRGVKFYITSEDRVLDPRNDHDWSALINMGQSSEVESRKTSKRVKRSTRAAAIAGRPHGRAPYGYRRTYGPHPETGKVVMLSQDIDPNEAPNILELFERIAAGHTIKSISEDWEALVWMPHKRRRDGSPFSPQHLRNLATHHAYAGKRIYIPGRGTASPGQAQVLDATWPAIVPYELFQAVQRILEDPIRKTTKPGRANHLASMIAVCDRCDGPLTVLLPGGKGPNLRKEAKYKCQRKGCIKVNQAEVDAVIEDEILTYLERPDVYQALSVASGEAEGSLSQVRAAIAAVVTELDELADSLGRGEVSPVMAGRAEARIRDRLRSLERQERELATPVALSRIPPGEDVRERWKAAPMSARREVARALLVPEVLGQVRVTVSPYRGAPAAERMLWRTADENPST